MSVRVQPFRIGQTVRLLPDLHVRNAGSDVYTVVRCNEPDSSNPNYVIRNEVDQRQRRELHSRLRTAVSEGETASSVFATGR